MPRSRADEWQDNYEVYTESQIESILERLDIEVTSDTNTHFLGYCPFHGNTESPAFAIDKRKGLWCCFNPACDMSGKLPELVQEVRGCNPLQAEMMIAKAKAGNLPLSQRLKEIREQKPDIVEFPQEKLDELHHNFKNSEKAQRYMAGRGFDEETMDYFQVGYSPARITGSGKFRPDMITVPMHDYKGMPVGLIGRTASSKKEDKAFKNSWGLPKRYTAWNIHRARAAGGSVIVVESSFDAMRVHQAGYPNVIALLGGSITDHHVKQIERYFTKVIIMTDYDKKRFEANCKKCGKMGHRDCKGHRAGRDLGYSIIEKLPSMKILWAAYEDGVVYPNGAKDASDMTDDEIRQTLRNAVSKMKYTSWNLD